MKLHIVKKFSIISLFLGFVVGFTSCDDFLDRPPISQVGPEQYFATSEHLSAYALRYYTDLFQTHSGWGLGTLRNDVNTDIFVATAASQTRYLPGNWRVTEKNSNFNFTFIRAFNFFFEQVLPKYEEGSITGNMSEIEHYIGEVYFQRAYEYFRRLVAFGDFPIITKTITESDAALAHNEIVELAKRAPRNEVARFILQDLDKALGFLQEDMKSKTRLTRDAALLFKSRVALFEASFLTYHKGTPRVPGEPGWPGAAKSYNSGFSIDLDAEIEFFLGEAMKAAKELGDKTINDLTPNSGVYDPTSNTNYTGWNQYFDMFSDVDMSKYKEVLFWRQYSDDFTKHTVGVYSRRGGNLGMTKSLVDGFVMQSGLPWYAAGAEYAGDVSTTSVKVNRDGRLRLFMFSEDFYYTLDPNVDINKAWYVPSILEQVDHRDVTGYRVRKCASFDPVQAQGSGMSCYYGSIIFRAVEAHLNYIEACYMRTGGLDATADQYWRAIRTRAGINPDYNVTIGATDMSRETADWAAYSAGVVVDPTLFNIRRERKNELMGESLRYNDLLRWRAMDQVNKYIVEGFNLWDAAYDNPEYKDANGNSKLIYDQTTVSNVSKPELGKYIRPYQIVRPNNELFDGWTWSKANYLEPLGFRDIELASPNKASIEQSNLYQNPYWPTKAGSALE